MGRWIALFVAFWGALWAGEPAYELSVCAMFQNEAQWLEEWIEYHQVVGVDHFFLYCDHSYDGYREVLEPYLESGVVDLVEWQAPGRRYCEGDARCDCLHYHGVESRWVAFLSLDEFLVPLGGQSLRGVLEGMEVKSVVEVPTVIFGTAGVEALAPGELLIERLVRCAGESEGMVRIEQPALRGGGVAVATGLRCNHYWGRTEEWAYGEQLFRVRTTDPERCDSWRAAREYVDEVMARASVREDHEILKFAPTLKRRLEEEQESAEQQDGGHKAEQARPPITTARK